MEAEIRFPTLPEQVPGPTAHTSPSKNTAEAMCEFMYETERLSKYFLISDYSLPYYCPTQAIGTGSRGGEQEKMDSGLQSKCPLWLPGSQTG